MDILNYLHSISINTTLDNVFVAMMGIIFLFLLGIIVYKVAKKTIGKKIKVVNMNISIAKKGFYFTLSCR